MRILKDTWPDGPWKTEPDRAEWIHAGYSCLAVRNQFGAWCGYVGVDRTHPAYGKFYNDVDVSVHGGLTHSNTCHGPICHEPQPGMPRDVWWLGFDCAHAFDLIPHPMLNFTEGIYRDLAYVTEEINSLAEQLRALATPQHPH